MLARCPSCHNTFSTEQSGRQTCPVCGKPLLVPEPNVAPPPPAAELVREGAGTPWERRAELGFWTGWGQTLQQALLEPGRLFAEARLDRGAAQLGFAVFTTSVFWAVGQILERMLLHGQTERMRQLIAAVAQNPDIAPMLKRMLQVQTDASTPGAVISLAALTPVFAFVLLYLNAGVTHAVAALLRQAKRGFPATFAACAYSCAPLVLLAVPACGWIVGTIWLVILTGIGMKVTHRISTAGAAASVLVPYLLICCLGFLAMGTLAVTLRNTLQP
ncbi:MAG TPA: Yip1 family protein [Myxococcales bacterium]|nr:Yip1 family protein [Myxococcales bacterium]